MTDKHPLTEELMYKIHGDKRGYSNVYDEDDMRAAADWQLEQVIDWLRHNLHFMPSGVDYIIRNLLKAMRPNTTQEDN